MSDREKLLAKIRALTAKTVDAGCTEAEALAAAEKAAALMREHQISDAIVEMDQGTMGVKFNTKSPKAPLCSVIAYCTNCSSIHIRNGSAKSVIYVGYAPGPQIACYLHDVVHRAVDTATKDFRNGRFYRARRTDKTRRKAVEDFVDGMVRSLSRRLLDMFRETIIQNHRNKAKAALENLFPDTKTVSHKDRKTRFDEAGWQGHRAADRVNLARGVDRSPVVGLIEKAGA